MLARFPHPKRHSGQTARGGFTLIEILAVILIISILMAFLLPAINRVRVTARVTQVRTEISAIESAMTTFKTQFGGVEPPSSIFICETASDWFLPGNSNSRAFIRQLWPQFDFTYSTFPSNQVDINGDSSYGGVALSPPECLVFFLGGMPTVTVSGGKKLFALSGFSKNPLFPFSPPTTGTNRDPAIFPFDTSRLIDLNSNGFPEYMDPLPAQTKPYVYYSSYDGQGYKKAEFGGGGLIEPYRQATSASSPVWNAKSCQIISPGSDREYGFGGAFVSGGSDHLPVDNSQYPNTITGATVPPTAKQRAYEEDNITNFHSAMLGGS